MKLNDLVRQYLPNPLAADSSLPQIAQQGEMAKEVFSLAGIMLGLVRNLVLACVVAVILWYYQLPLVAIVLAVGSGFLVILVGAYLRYRKLKSLAGVDKNQSGQSFKQIVVIDKYYDFLISSVGFVFTTIGLVVVLFAFRVELALPINSGALASLSWTKVISYYILFNFLGVIVSGVRWLLFKNLPETGDTAQIHQSATLIEQKLELLTFLPGAVIALLLMSFFDVPGIYIVSFGLFLTVFAVVSIIIIYRISKVNLAVKTPSQKLEKVSILNGESVQLALYGIRKLTSRWFLFGAGKVANPQNSLIVTNNRFLFLLVPVTGGDNMVLNTDYSRMNFFWNRGEIEKAGKEILESTSLEEIAKTYATDQVKFEDVKTIVLQKMQLTITTQNQEVHKYLFMDRNYVEPLKSYLSTKFNSQFTYTE